MADLFSVGVALLRHPLAQRFISRSDASGDNRIYSADDVLGERLVRVGALLVLETEQPGWMIIPANNRESALLEFARLALSATPYLWTEEVRAACRQIRLPEHVISPRALPAPRSWHTFETGIAMGGTLDYEGRRHEALSADAMLVSDTSSGFVIYTLGEMTDTADDSSRPCLTCASVPYGRTYPDGLEDDSRRKMAEGVLTMFAFLNSPYIPKRQAAASRGARREAARLGAPLADELVTFVILRRPEQRSNGTDAPAQHVEWRHRWLVNGHVRAQWYPSEQAHRLIWIAPYLKGPDDAPMLDHAYKVAR